MTLKASPLSNRGVRAKSEYPRVENTSMMHPGGVPQHLVLLKGHTLRGASIRYHLPPGIRYAQTRGY